MYVRSWKLEINDSGRKLASVKISSASLREERKMEIILRLVKKIAVAKYRVFSSLFFAFLETKSRFFFRKINRNHEVNPLVRDPGVAMEVVTGRAESI